MGSYGWRLVESIRSLFLNPFGRNNRKTAQHKALPVGVPPAITEISNSQSSDGSTTSAYLIQKKLKEAETKVTKLTNELNDHQMATEHAGYLIESFLFPKMGNVTEEGTNKTKPLDIFTVLHKDDGWFSLGPSKEEPEISDSFILKTCLIDMSLDYCTRLSKRLTTEYLDEIALLSQNKYPSFAEMETELREIVKNHESYCSMFDDCFSGDFKDEKCRPSACPFDNDAACRYVSSCLSENIMQEYEGTIFVDESSSS